MKNLETEFKWDANTARAFFRMQQALLKTVGRESISPGGKLHIEDTYLDTPTRTFEKQQIAFRIRHYANKWEATFKTRTEIKNGKAVRREETLALPGVKNLSEGLAFLRQKNFWKGLPLEHLTVLFRIQNQRTLYQIVYKNMTAEMAFDACKILVAGRRVFMKEIELEYKQGSEKDLAELANICTAKCGLPYARVSKVKTACGLLKLWGGYDGISGAVI